MIYILIFLKDPIKICVFCFNALKTLLPNRREEMSLITITQFEKERYLHYGVNYDT